MDEGVEAVDGAGDPGDEEGAKEEEGDAGVEPGFRVRLAEGGVTGQGAHAEDDGGGGGRGVVGLRVGADLDVDGVRVEAGAGAGSRGRFAGEGVEEFVLGVGGVEGGGGEGVGGDVDFGGDDALEGVFVEGVKEALELVSVLPDFAEG